MASASPGAASKRDKDRAARAFAPAALKIPAFPNAFPYNELLLDGKLIAKTRSWEWKHRGLTLLYTSTKVHRAAADAHKLDPKKYPKKVLVGVGDLVDVRALTEDEVKKLFRQFNNLPNRWTHSDLGDDWIEPFDIGFFFKDLRRFKEPVPFNWPSGPIKPIGIPLTTVAAALKGVGIRKIGDVRF